MAKPQIDELVKNMPEVYNQFMDITGKLEKHYKDMQDVEFTIERGKLWMLQTRNGKRTAKSTVKIAVDMASENLISKEEAVLRVTPEVVDALLHPQFDEKAKKDAVVYAKGVNASPGAAVGQAYFDADTAERMAKEEKQATIMVRPFTKPDDVHGMIAAKGILTSEGGATSHAAVVARQFGSPAGGAGGAEDVHAGRRHAGPEHVDAECTGDRRAGRRLLPGVRERGADRQARAARAGRVGVDAVARARDAVSVVP